MKFRWHLFFLLLAVVTTVLLFLIPQQPIWEIAGQPKVWWVRGSVKDREWYLIVSDAEQKQWHLETYRGYDRNPSQRLLLDIPSTKGSYQHVFLGTAQVQDAALVFMDMWTERTSDGGLRVEETAWLLDQQTGKRLRSEPFKLAAMGNRAVAGNRIALAELEHVWLYDGKHDPGRPIALKYAGNLTFSSDGKLLFCTSSASNQLYVIDWEKGIARELTDFPHRVYSMNSITNDTLVIRNRGGEVSRWKWNGTQLIQVSPGIHILYNAWPMRSKVDPQGHLHVAGVRQKDWPHQLRPLLKWLQSLKVPVERWIPQSDGQLWHVLDDQHRIVRDYHLPGLSRTRFSIYDDLSVEVKQQDSSTTLRLWSDVPRWPNALAAGILVYLAGYVAMRCWRNNYPPLMM